MDPSQQPQSSHPQSNHTLEMPCSMQLIANEVNQVPQEASQHKKPRRQSGNSSVNNFIQKTFDILQEKRFQSIVSWAQNTDILTSSKNSHEEKEPINILRKSSINEKVCSFKIHNVKAFEQIVLPQYFKHSNMSSFVRQVHFPLYS